ncbi:CaiB/BaiF CoA transferase family protein [Paraburkholderia sp. BCC1886]|uniref:CaiB/BaiF CoA transferase family protein n=1 Tax=Paraburkholderia sp. BCC1886 TaxID=2562670 RepID=UPI001642FB2C|nr:CaiB/BaiF CoA-transferase family protein [Paraburkholderia sp. BCC1886]
MMSATPNVQTGALPLAGLRVLELGHIVAGPAAGQILADLGADVIKIENVDGGDQVRQMPGAMASMFSMLNRNKRSLAVDLRGEGAEVFRRLAARSDVVIDNFSYEAMDRLGLGYRTMSALYPQLVWLTIKGFLPGPREAQPMLDELAQMAGGLAFMTGTADKPSRAGASVIDLGAATYGVVAVLAALRQRDANGGQGQLITAGLFETSVYLVGQWMANAQHEDAPSVPLATMQQGKRMGFSIYQLFDTADASKVFLGITSNAHWQRFCAALELPDLAADSRFLTVDARVEHRNELVETLTAILRRHTQAELDARLEPAGVPFAPVRRPDQLHEETHLRESGQLLATPLANGRIGDLPKLPVRSSTFDMTLRAPPPLLGGDTQDVLAELGYSEEQVAGLHECGAIGLPGDLRDASSGRH